MEMEIRGFIKPTKKSFPSFVYMAVVRRGTVGVDRRHNWSLLQIAEHRFPNKPTIEGLGPCSTGLLTLVHAAPVSSPWSVQHRSPRLGPCSTGLLTLVHAAPVSSPWSVQHRSPHLGPCSTGLLALVHAAPVSSPWSMQHRSPHLGLCSTGLLTLVRAARSPHLSLN